MEDLLTLFQREGSRNERVRPLEGADQLVGEGRTAGGAVATGAQAVLGHQGSPGRDTGQ